MQQFVRLAFLCWFDTATLHSHWQRSFLQCRCQTPIGGFAFRCAVLTSYWLPDCGFIPFLSLCAYAPFMNRWCNVPAFRCGWVFLPAVSVGIGAVRAIRSMPPQAFARRKGREVCSIAGSLWACVLRPQLSSFKSKGLITSSFEGPGMHVLFCNWCLCLAGGDVLGLLVMMSQPSDQWCLLLVLFTLACSVCK